MLMACCVARAPRRQCFRRPHCVQCAYVHVSEAAKQAQKLWTTGAGDELVTEHRWEQGDKSEREGAVIELHGEMDSQKDTSGVHGFGVLKEDKNEDIRALVDSFTAPALAAALRDRETSLHTCAHLLEQGNLELLRKALKPFTAQYVSRSRRAHLSLDVTGGGFTRDHMFTLRKYLTRMPRHITKLTEHRASVMIPLCNVDGVASLLFTRRSGSLRTHKNEVCFPGGKVDMGLDQHIVHTALREMAEEIGVPNVNVDVLGILRCDWSEVASIVGVAVTPVVGFLGDLTMKQIKPNPDEVSDCFTIPMKLLLQGDKWMVEKYKAPVFTGGPYIIWGLTGYLLHRFVMDVLQKHLVVA